MGKRSRAIGLLGAILAVVVGLAGLWRRYVWSNAQRGAISLQADREQVVRIQELLDELALRLEEANNRPQSYARRDLQLRLVSVHHALTAIIKDVRTRGQP